MLADIHTLEEQEFLRRLQELSASTKVSDAFHHLATRLVEDDLHVLTNTRSHPAPPRILPAAASIGGPTPPSSTKRKSSFGDDRDGVNNEVQPPAYDLDELWRGSAHPPKRPCTGSTYPHILPDSGAESHGLYSPVPDNQGTYLLSLHIQAGS